MVKKIQGKKVKLVFYNAPRCKRKEMAKEIFRILETIDLTSGRLIIRELISLKLNADLKLHKKPAKRIIYIYCK